MAKKRVILMYISEISGHHSATLAIERALKFLNDEIKVININIFNYTNPISERVVNKLYMGAIKKFPWIWDYLYDNIKIKRIIDYLKIFVHRVNIPKLRDLFQQFKPEVVVCSQAYPCGMVADYKKFYPSDIKLIAVLTDFIPHSYWIYDTVDYYIAPSPEVAQKLVHKGVSLEKIKILGIPVDICFTEALSQQQIIRKLGLSDDLPKILIMGGGQGLGPISSIVESLNEIDMELEIIVVTGINRKLYRILEAKMNNFKHKLLLFGFVNNIAELMTISDIIITKPGGITTAEALCKNLPMVIVEPIPGQEMSNARYLISKGAAVLLEKPAQTKDILKELLLNKEKLERMRKASAEISKPTSSIDIAKLILALIN
ncbi:MAG: glycosyltransferase [Candidatus Omnitrophica bacterium]|nr:glycosyltransferase [Candidatus Omnitrophota bacterium]